MPPRSLQGIPFHYVSHPRNHTSSVAAVLVSDLVRASADQTGGGLPAATDDLVSQESSDFRRCAGLGVQGVVGPGAADFLWVASATDTVKVPRAFVERMTDAVCYAA